MRPLMEQIDIPRQEYMSPIISRMFLATREVVLAILKSYPACQCLAGVLLYNELNTLHDFSNNASPPQFARQ